MRSLVFHLTYDRIFSQVKTIGNPLFGVSKRPAFMLGKVFEITFLQSRKLM